VRRGAKRDADFGEYYQARGAVVRRAAYLLCGDWHLAEDLAQAAFIKLFLAWPRVDRERGVDAYVHTVLVRTYLDERRRPWRRERPYEAAALPDRVYADDPAVAEHLAMRAALAGVPPRQRAVLVLRFWLDLSVEQTAEILRCSPGTVKSQSSRGLAALRDVLDSYSQPSFTGGPDHD
jgi:RNA polymerase sigma-70 factor (sigma-E family)